MLSDVDGSLSAAPGVEGVEVGPSALKRGGGSIATDWSFREGFLNLGLESCIGDNKSVLLRLFPLLSRKKLAVVSGTQVPAKGLLVDVRV